MKGSGQNRAENSRQKTLQTEAHASQVQPPMDGPVSWPGRAAERAKRSMKDHVDRADVKIMITGVSLHVYADPESQTQRSPLYT